MELHIYPCLSCIANTGLNHVCLRLHAPQTKINLHDYSYIQLFYRALFCLQSIRWPWPALPAVVINSASIFRPDLSAAQYSCSLDTSALNGRECRLRWSCVITALKVKNMNKELNRCLHVSAFVLERSENHYNINVTCDCFCPHLHKKAIRPEQ